MDIPIEVARDIARTYGYDQVVIIARKADREFQDGHEHVTTYGEGNLNRKIAAHIGAFIKHKIMGWPDCRHYKTHSIVGSSGQVMCDECGIIMPDEMGFWEFPTVGRDE